MMKDGHHSCSHIAPWFPRIGFGIFLFAYGVRHYMDLAGFRAMASQPFESISALAMVAGLLAIVFPALQILGGILVATRQLCSIAKICVLGALGGIVGWAGLAILVGADMQMYGGLAQNAIILLLLYSLVKKFDCSCCTTSTGPVPMK